MMRYWVPFARTGNPNVPNQLHWPTYTTTAPRTLVLIPTGDKARTDIAAEHNCAFWSQIQS